MTRTIPAGTVLVHNPISWDWPACQPDCELCEEINHGRHHGGPMSQNAAWHHIEMTNECRKAEFHNRANRGDWVDAFYICDNTEHLPYLSLYADRMDATTLNEVLAAHWDSVELKNCGHPVRFISTREVVQFFRKAGFVTDTEGITPTN
jgi:hypothetical protein